MISHPTSTGLRFRSEIERAETAGVLREDMTLHLTLRDVAGLKRDRDLPVTDISFVGGVMRYLGVAIVQGDVSESALHCEGRPEGA